MKLYLKLINKQKQGGFISAIFLQPIVVVVLLIIVLAIVFVIVKAIISLAQLPPRKAPPDDPGQEIRQQQSGV